MNKFTIYFKNALGEFKTEDFNLDFYGTPAVAEWFEDTFGLRAKSVSKHQYERANY